MKLLSSILLVVVGSVALATERPSFHELCVKAVEEGALGTDIPGGIQSVFSFSVASFLRRGQVQPEASVSQRVQEQAKEVGIFLSGLIHSLDGLPSELLPFNRVEIVSRNIFGQWRTMEMDGKTLIIRMGLVPHSADKLRSLYRRGKQYDLFSTERSLWPYANPTGNLLVEVHSKIKIASALALEAVRKLKAKAQATVDGQGSLGEVRNEVEGYLQAAAGSLLKHQELDFLRSAPAEELVSFLNRLEQKLGDPQSIQRLFSQTRFERGKVKAKLVFSFIGYGNLHWIRVVVGYGERAESVLLTSPSPDASFEMWFSVALVGYTMDIIEVQTFFDRLHIAEGIRAALVSNGP